MGSEDRALATREQGGQVTTATSFRFTPQTFAEQMKYAEMVANSDLVPKDYRGKPGNVVVAMQMGAEVGLPALQAVQGIAVINGRPSIWGDHALALVQASGKLESITETDDGETATCSVKRVGSPVVVTRTFSMTEAKQAGLAGKDGPWRSYPKRMRQMRARAFAIRDGFADVMKGLCVAEEVQDYDVEATATDVTGRRSAGVEAELPTPRSQRATAQATAGEAPKAQAQAQAQAPAQAQASNGNGHGAAAQVEQPDELEGEFRVAEVTDHPTANKSTWCSVLLDNGVRVGSFHRTPGEVARQALTDGAPVRVRAKRQGKFLTIDSLEIATPPQREPGDDGDQPQDAKVVA